MASAKKTRNLALQELDLGENEATLYSLMLSHPRCTVRELTTRAPFPRTMLYYVLNQLMQRGLVAAKKEKTRTVYVAEDPERLYELLAEREHEFEQEKNAIRDLIPRMKRQYRLAGERPNVRTFDGVEDYQKALDDVIISKPKEIMAYENIAKKRPALTVRDAHERQRITRKIKKKILFFESSDALRFLARRTYDDFTEFRNVRDSSVLPFSVDLAIYDGKLLYTSYYDEHEPTAVLIEDRALYAMQKSIFDALWKQGKDRTLVSIK